MKKSTIIIIIFTLLFGVSCFFAGRYSIKTGTTTTTKTEIREIPYFKERVIIDSVPGKIKYRIKTDTQIIYVDKPLVVHDSTPYVATLDTVIKKDTFNLMFLHPEKLFSFKALYHPDTLKIPVIVTNTEIVKESGWFEKVLYAGAGIGIGFLIGGAK